MNVRDIGIKEIKVGKHDVRVKEDETGIEDLAASIGRMGIIVPLVVVADNDGFVLVAGHRRIKAAKSIGMESVPCDVRTNDEFKETEISLAENLFREDLTPVELAATFKDVMDNKIMTIDELARVLHKSISYIRRHLDILQWPEEVQVITHSGTLSVAAASNLALVTDDEYRKFLIHHAVNNGATARTTAAWLQSWRAMQPPETAIEAEPVEGEERPQPLVPQAPCILCGEIFRTDELCHVPTCAHCIRIIREKAAERG